MNDAVATNDSSHKTEANRRPDETSPFDWPAQRHQAIIDLKQEALRYAKRIWADYVFVSIVPESRIGGTLQRTCTIVIFLKFVQKKKRIDIVIGPFIIR